MINLSTTSCS